MKQIHFFICDCFPWEGQGRLSVGLLVINIQQLVIFCCKTLVFLSEKTGPSSYIQYLLILIFFFFLNLNSELCHQKKKSFKCTAYTILPFEFVCFVSQVKISPHILQEINQMQFIKQNNAQVLWISLPGNRKDTYKVSLPYGLVTCWHIWSHQLIWASQTRKITRHFSKNFLAERLYWFALSHSLWKDHCYSA